MAKNKLYVHTLKGWNIQKRKSSAAFEIEYSQIGMWECTFYGLDHSGSQPFNYAPPFTGQSVPDYCRAGSEATDLAAWASNLS